MRRPVTDKTTDEQPIVTLGVSDPSVLLTLAAHPDPARLGQRMTWSHGGTLSLSRSEPHFGSGPQAGGLAHTSVSRRPVGLRLGHGGLLIDPSGVTGLVLDGAPLSSATTLSLEQLARGVALEVGRRVALWIEAAPAAPEPAGDSLGIVGRSHLIAHLRAAIRLEAHEAAPVLIRGETGVGKELVARALHALGPRAAGPFVPVNVAAIPAPTAMAELFGHARGAFTGAEHSSRGYFGAAHRGTLLLDEIGELAPEVQVVLLRVLESGEIQPLGAVAPLRPQLRLLMATDARLEAGLLSGRIRAALYHRLSRRVLDVPPLRARRADIPCLYQHFAPELPSPPAAAMSRWLRHGWPGNIRELQGQVERLRMDWRFDGTPEVREARFERLALQSSEALGAPPGAAGTLDRPAAPPRRRASALDANTVRRALEDNGHAIAPTARALGVSNGALHDLIARTGLVRRAVTLSDAEVGAALAECGQDPAAAARALGVSRRALVLRLRQASP